MSLVNRHGPVSKAPPKSDADVHTTDLFLRSRLQCLHVIQLPPSVDQPLLIQPGSGHIDTVANSVNEVEAFLKFTCRSRQTGNVKL